MAFKISSG